MKQKRTQAIQQHKPEQRKVEAPMAKTPEIISEPIEEEIRIDSIVEEKLEEEKNEPIEQNRYVYQDIENAPTSGRLIVVSETGNDKGDIVIWKKTRAFVRGVNKWQDTGFFIHNITGLKLDYVPKFWREKGLYEI